MRDYLCCIPLCRASLHFVPHILLSILLVEEYLVIWKEKLLIIFLCFLSEACPLKNVPLIHIPSPLLLLIQQKRQKITIKLSEYCNMSEFEKYVSDLVLYIPLKIAIPVGIMCRFFKQMELSHEKNIMRFSCPE